MKLISHRGNLNGPDPSIENNPTHINKVLELGYDVEIDLWFKEGNYYLGHDEPYYKIDKHWILSRKDNLWVHLKNLESIETETVKTLNYFWHESDKFTLTSKGIPWCFPGIYIRDGITVCLEKNIEIDSKILGICTDFVEDYK
jgi:hypothetical protein